MSWDDGMADGSAEGEEEEEEAEWGSKQFWGDAACLSRNAAPNSKIELVRANVATVQTEPTSEEKTITFQETWFTLSTKVTMNFLGFQARMYIFM
jgi:hypothetical protein